MVKKKTRRRMILITVHLTKEQVELLDKLVEMHVFPNRSEAIRVAIRELIDKYLYRVRKGVVEITEPLVLGLA